MKLRLATNADHIRMPSLASIEAKPADLSLDKFLLRFLRVQKFDVGKAKAMIEKYLSLRRQKPDWFQAVPDEKVRGHFPSEILPIYFTLYL